MDKKKILYIHHGSASGGAPRSLSFLSKHLDKSMFEPYVLIMYDEEKNRKMFEDIGAKVIYCRYMRAWHGSTVSGGSLGVVRHNIEGAVPSYINMKRIIRKINPDIVHLNSTCLFIQAMAIKRFNKNIPIVCHAREPLLPNFLGSILRIMNEKYINHYIAIEQYDADTLKPTKHPLDVINNFVAFETYNSDVKSNCLREEFGLSEKDTVFLYLARVVPQNGAVEMVKAAATTLNKRKDIHIFIVGCDLMGTDKYYSELQSEVKKLKNNNVHLVGFRNDVPNVIASSDAIIVPFQEPHSARSIIEASAMGKPILASDIGGPKEMVVDKKTGFLFDYKSFSDFEQKLEELANNKELRARMGRNALKYAEEHFDADKNAKRTIDIYENFFN